MKLYGALASPYVVRVVMAARLKGIDLPVEMPPGGLKSPEFLAKNPLGKIPALEHDGKVVVESQLICEYLEDVVPEPPLVRRDPYGRYRAKLFCRMADLYLHPPANVLVRNMNPKDRDEKAVEAAKATLVQTFDQLEQLVEAPFATGNAMTLADCALLPALHTLRTRLAPAHGLGDSLATRPKLAAWWKTMEGNRVAGPLMGEYAAAVEEFVRMMAAQAAQAAQAAPGVRH
jgi:glutathione S-transferase